MTKHNNVPDVIPLDDESVLYLSIAYAWLDISPPKLRRFARLNSSHLNSHIWTRKTSPYGLLASAYIGCAPLPTSHRRFIAIAQNVNKLEPHPESDAFLKNDAARENSAASEYGMSRGELKRLFERVDTIATKFGFDSYDAVFRCRDLIVHDPSLFAPVDRETFAEGPLHLWDFAKAVSEHELTDMSFDTFDGWILFIHQENGVIYGHAVHPLAHRLGGFSRNPLIDFVELQLRGDDASPVINVPRAVQEAVMALADRCFPGQPFEFMPPPMMSGGTISPTKSIRPDLLRPWTDV